MRRFCITGGIACGKSLFSNFLREFGIETIDADDVVHTLEAPGGDAVDAIREIFGDGSIGADGGVDRKAVAKMAFADEGLRKKLESVLHPLVRARIDEFLRGGLCRVAVIPLLFETGWAKDFDFVICLSSKREVQIARMMSTRDYGEEESKARLAAQMSVEEKARISDFVVDNSGTVEELREKARMLALKIKNETKEEK